MHTTKRMTAIALFAGLTIIGVSLFVASHVQAAEKSDADMSPMKIQKAVCVLTPTLGNVVGGTVTFTQEKDGVKIVADVKGLSPGKHGFHVHEFGDLTSLDGKSLGGHFNPDNAPHAGPDADQRHVGDLGNIEADTSGHGHYERVDKVISLDMCDPHCIIGRGMVVHAGEDDLSTQPTGNAGARVAVGIIGVAQMAKPSPK